MEVKERLVLIAYGVRYRVAVPFEWLGAVEAVFEVWEETGEVAEVLPLFVGATGGMHAVRVHDRVKLVFVLGQAVDLQQGEAEGGQGEEGRAEGIDQVELLQQVLGPERVDQGSLEGEDLAGVGLAGQPQQLDVFLAILHQLRVERPGSSVRSPLLQEFRNLGAGRRLSEA